MILIREIVQQALNTGCLTIEAEEQLRRLLNTKYDREDFNAFMTLQEAAMTGQVKQESRERLSLLKEVEEDVEVDCIDPFIVRAVGVGRTDTGCLLGHGEPVPTSLPFIRRAGAVTGVPFSSPASHHYASLNTAQLLRACVSIGTRSA